jgi:hypothetical protein
MRGSERMVHEELIQAFAQTLVGLLGLLHLNNTPPVERQRSRQSRGNGNVWPFGAGGASLTSYGRSAGGGGNCSAPSPLPELLPGAKLSAQVREASQTATDQENRRRFGMVMKRL